MYWIIYVSFALLISATQSLRKHRWKLGPELASLAELADIGSNLKSPRNSAIDMDYFGGSSERLLKQRTSDETSTGTSEIEHPQVNSGERGNPVIVYITDPNVLGEYQEKLKKVRAVRGSSLERGDGVTYEDLMKFLIQVSARLKEQRGTNPLADHPNLIDLIRNTRRRNDDDIYETEQVEPAPAKFDISDEPVKKVRAPRMKITLEKYTPKERPRNKIVIREEPPRMKKKKMSMEEPPRSSFGKRGSIARIPKFEPLSQRDLFRTPKPFIGKVGIYEDK